MTIEKKFHQNNTPMPEPTAPKAQYHPFHIMVKPSGARCNLDCEYCYFLSKEALYPESQFKMSDQMLERYIRQYVESSPTPEITFSWQGGEPTLLGIDFFKKAIEYQQKFTRSGTRIINTIQTNGTLLNESWCRFFKKYGFLVGISIDGPKELHDYYRVNKAGKGSLEKVLKGWRLLKKIGVDTNILCCVHQKNQSEGKAVYRFFRDKLDAKFIQFIPMVERVNLKASSQDQIIKSKRRPLYIQAGSGVTNRSVSAAGLGQFLKDVFGEWVQKDIGDVYIQHFDVALGLWYGQPSGLCTFSKSCGNAMALEHNGDLYSCDHFVEPDYFLGNIKQTHMRDLASSAEQIQFGHSKVASLPKVCRECEYLFACAGGCPKNRFIKTSDGESGLNYLCEGYKAFFSHITPTMSKMVDLLHQNRSPADLMNR